MAFLDEKHDDSTGMLEFRLQNSGMIAKTTDQHSAGTSEAH